MSTSDARAIAEINKLIEVCKDGENGFDTAANGVKDALLRVELGQYSDQRGLFVIELQKQVVALGGKAENSGSAAGALHRGWIDIKAAVVKYDDHTILEECERGEDAAKKAYEMAVSGTDIPGTILPLIEKQYEQVKQTHDRIKALRDGVTVSSR